MTNVNCVKEKNKIVAGQFIVAVVVVASAGYCSQFPFQHKDFLFWHQPQYYVQFWYNFYGFDCQSHDFFLLVFEDKGYYLWYQLNFYTCLICFTIALPTTIVPELLSMLSSLCENVTSSIVDH